MSAFPLSLFVLSVVAVGLTGAWAWYYLRGPTPVLSTRSDRLPAPDVRPVPVPAAFTRVDAVRPPIVEEPSIPRVTFNDVAGLDDAVGELSELKDYLLHPERFLALGASLPKGVLLVGPPGTGKTLLAKALAGEAGVPFQVVSAAGLVEVYVGVGSSRIRQVFAQARKQAPSIVFIDELDAIGRSRSMHAAGGQEERESTLNQLLIEMDGFDSTSGVLVVGATNRPDVLDPALLRPGRFDRRLVITAPDLRGRQDILAVHSRAKPLAGNADLASVARRTAGFTGADLANVMNEAALLAGRRYKNQVGAAELEEAIDRVLCGSQRPSRVISPRDRRVIAYHEAGHVLVAKAVALGHEVHRVSIVARGLSNGYTVSVPTEDRVLLSRSELQAQLTVLLGGRAAEELVFSEATTGAQDDLARAGAIAHSMVAEFGMSDDAAPFDFGTWSTQSVAGFGDGAPAGFDAAETRRLISQARATATGIVAKHRIHLDRLAERLIDVETIEKDEIDEILADMRPAPTLVGC